MDIVPGLFIKMGILNISDKEILLLKKTYRQITEQFYEDSSETNAAHIVLLNDLLCSTI